MLEMKLNGIKKFREATLVVNNITFEAYEGEKVGIVGANGSGKSTILKLIAGIEPMNYYPGYPQTSSPGYDEGLIHLPRNATKAYLEQSPVYPKGLKVLDVLNMAFEEIDSIESQMRDLEEQMKILVDAALEKALKKYSDLVQLFEVKGGYEREEKLSKVCTGLNFTQSFLDKDFDLLSGGEKTTVVLGKLLIHNPDILLLDEPTNHLDMKSIEWLEGYLKNYKGIVIIVSHDRYFLDNVVSKVVEIEDMESITYKGNYSSFISQKEENMRIQYEHFREQQKRVNNMEKQVMSLRDWAMRADNNKFFRRAASIQKKLDKMARIDKPIFERRNMRLDFKAAGRSGNETIKAIGLSKSYEDKVILKNTDLMIHYGERVGLIGPNGSGKTTFLKMLLGEEQPDKGVVELGANVMAAYLPQKITFNNEEDTLLQCFREDISIVEGKAREYLSKFMFYKGSVFKKVKHLSGGERIRLKLAMLLFQDINLLILDEPTNHLDIDSIETLEEALEDFKGTIFFISHDRYFINKIGERIIAVEDHSLKSYPGNYDDYKIEKEKMSQQDSKAPIVKAEKAKKQKNNSDVINQEAAKVKALSRIENLENAIKEIDIAMAANQMDHEELNKLYGRKLGLSDELDSVMNDWLNLGS
ncbi:MULTISPECIES: ribosomal protection-like ABC-F family protein [unclassified Bacillus (in: firmicutes)]|uniref:ribosomal protection-like ABC-F family protein n=1 Tax=unclassified Bacillus (in: firmicutes) TaxID=185979 RepID=UPI0008E24F64|nr:MULTISPECIES: ATP-binding cassette domain-containing protein [unclassified Bacillus (in: firmicutes)]SFB06358.1 ATPase components of ABC transporters with duplicated ATPase domains [Bacillus sp. UNCCL13]SFQ87684.1 ATPase components of ABC transporters with duplicated ATPase domains [Bacillus sp. cl95]